MDIGDIDLAKLFGRHSEIEKFFEEHGGPAERSDAGADLGERLAAVVRQCFTGSGDSGDGEIAEMRAKLEGLLPDFAEAAVVVRAYVDAARCFAIAVELSRKKGISAADRAEFHAVALRSARIAKRMSGVVRAHALFCALLVKLEDNITEYFDALADKDFEIRTGLAICEAEASILAKKLLPDAG